MIPFSWAPGICLVSPSRFPPLLTITVLHGIIRLDGTTVPPGISQSVRVLRLKTIWYRNINLFPFRYTRVTVQLRTD